MKILHLLRHAKSSWDDPDQDDHDRPLAPRGARAARLMGRHLRARGFRPASILCSTARRAVDTLGIVLSQLDEAAPSVPPVLYERGLYLAGDRILLERLRRMDDAAGDVLLVGHNPDIQNLALALAGHGDREVLARIAAKYPTAGFATLTFDAAHWRDVAPGQGTLVEFVVPKNLT